MYITSSSQPPKKGKEKNSNHPPLPVPTKDNNNNNNNNNVSGYRCVAWGYRDSEGAQNKDDARFRWSSYRRMSEIPIKNLNFSQQNIIARKL